MKKILEYIKQKYEPLAIIVYGSYADGSNNAHSDFDALVIAKEHNEFHDASFVDGIQLDVFIYPHSYFEREFDCDNLVQIYDGKIIMDTDECASLLKKHILEYVDGIPLKTEEEIHNEIEWCNKMLLRTKRADVEGVFRWHWLLTESLEIFCDIMHQKYWGPKKSLKWMEKQYPEAYECYKNALVQFNSDTISRWISYLENRFKSGESF